MEDRELMERELNLIKGASTLYLHGAIESETKEVHEAFQCALEESINIQNHIYNLMKEKGWYPTETAEQQKIDMVKQKFNA
ncbi:MAG: spore coat protein [Clostridia bacterium]|nr:spore coat protein [Clostridia bacterium]